MDTYFLLVSLQALALNLSRPPAALRAHRCNITSSEHRCDPAAAATLAAPSAAAPHGAHRAREAARAYGRHARAPLRVRAG